VIVQAVASASEAFLTAAGWFILRHAHRETHTYTGRGRDREHVEFYCKR